MRQAMRCASIFFGLKKDGEDLVKILFHFSWKGESLWNLKMSLKQQ